MDIRKGKKSTDAVGVGKAFQQATPTPGIQGTWDSDRTDTGHLRKVDRWKNHICSFPNSKNKDVLPAFRKLYQNKEHRQQALIPTDWEGRTQRWKSDRPCLGDAGWDYRMVFREGITCHGLWRMKMISPSRGHFFMARARG